LGRLRSLGAGEESGNIGDGSGESHSSKHGFSVGKKSKEENVIGTHSTEFVLRLFKPDDWRMGRLKSENNDLGGEFRGEKLVISKKSPSMMRSGANGGDERGRQFGATKEQSHKRSGVQRDEGRWTWATRERKKKGRECRGFSWGGKEGWETGVLRAKFRWSKDPGKIEKRSLGTRGKDHHRQIGGGETVLIWRKHDV